MCGNEKPAGVRDSLPVRSLVADAGAVLLGVGGAVSGSGLRLCGNSSLRGCAGLYLLPAAEDGEEDDEGDEGVEEAAYEGYDADDCADEEPDGAGVDESGAASGVICPCCGSLEGFESGKQLDVSDDHQNEPGNASDYGDEIGHDSDYQKDVGDVDVLGCLAVCICRLNIDEFLDVQEEQYISDDNEYLADGVKSAESASGSILSREGGQNAYGVEEAVDGAEYGSEDTGDGVDPDGLDDHACVLRPG